MKDQISARTVYMNAQNALRTALTAEGKYTPDQVETMIQNAVLSQSYLRLEQIADTTRTSYTFPVMVGTPSNSGASQSITEQRLKLQDTFYVSEIGLYLVKNPSAGSNAGVPYTYPNPFVFPTGGAPLYAIYTGGFLSLVVNGSVIIEELDCQQFLMIPQTQQTAAFAAASPQTEFYGAGAKSAQCVIEPNILFIGSKNNQFALNLKGSALSAVDANTVIAIVIRGILMQNVTVVS